ncbi:MAG TPA: S9 family peptidase [Vicinamibacterales bacterium]|nr:S9 family peptidase [Vicinamibacterales bacterium]
MKKPLLSAVVRVAGVLAAAAVAAQAPITPEQTLDRRSIGERGEGLAFSPDGSRVVFTVAEPAKGTVRPRAIWMLDVARETLRQLTFSGRNDSSPRWAPDGGSIAFLSDRDGPSQLYRLPMRGGEAEKLTDRKDAIRAFRWSPDGRRIALLMPEPKPDATQQRERDKDDARVEDRDERHARVWLLDVATHQLTQATTINWRIEDIEWTPDGAGLIAVARPRPESDQWNERIYAIDLHDGHFTPIGEPHRPIGGLAVSPDGRTVAYVGGRIDGPSPHDLYLQPTAGGEPRNLTATSIDRQISQVRWIDNESLLVSVGRGFATELASVGRDGRARTIDRLDVNPSQFARSADGTIAFVGETATRPAELWLRTADGSTRALTRFNEKWASIPIVPPELVKYKSADGVEIEAALLRPTTNHLAANPSSPQSPVAGPLVVLVHGGPTGRWSDAFEPWGQLLAARGYAVLYPNVRGSTGYGHRFVGMNRADWGGGDFKDVMAGVDWAIARGIADPNRLGIGGWSYGGYMAAWAVTQTTRFKAAVSGAPVIDMASEFGTENESGYDEWFYGTPYEKLEGFIRSSPMTYVRNVKTPTLLLQGADDETDPIGQSQQFYRGLKRYNVEAELVVYPREPHGLREEKHLVDRLNRIVAWYDKYLSARANTTGLQF